MGPRENQDDGEFTALSSVLVCTVNQGIQDIDDTRASEVRNADDACLNYRPHRVDANP